jgi:enamine deaminase RidA (YjgF/YER057c/UK114 family)
LFCAGQASFDADGTVRPGDIGAQLARSLDNLETVLKQAGTDPSRVVRLNYYTTDVDGLLGVWHLIAEHLGKADCRPAPSSASPASRSPTCWSRSKPLHWCHRHP